MWGTTSNYPRVKSFADAEKLYTETKPLRGRPDFRPLDSRSSRAKTKIWKQGDSYVIQMYNTDIVKYFPDGDVLINHGRFRTVSTAAALSALSPFSCWCSNNALVARCDAGTFAVPAKGLLFKAGVPVDPPVAQGKRVLVNKERAKELRAYFKDLPALVTTMRQLGTPRAFVPRPRSCEILTGTATTEELVEFAKFVVCTGKPVWGVMYRIFVIHDTEYIDLPYGVVMN